MEKRIIGRGLLAGALGGVLAFIWSWIFIEPVIDRAIEFEDGVSAAHEAIEHGGHAHEHGAEGGIEITRTVQSTIGLGFGLVAFSVAMGALLAVLFCVAYGRIAGPAGRSAATGESALSARATAVLLAGGMLISLWIVPSLKYPPNPPAVSLDETIQQRTLLYLLLTVLSAALLVGSVLLARKLAPKFGAWNASLLGAADYIVSMAVVFLLMPTISETPGPITDDAGTILFGAFPADDLYEFRLYSLGTQVVMWTTIGLVFAALVSRLLDQRQRDEVTV
ncbi:cobalt transporter [Mycobacterium sp. Root265]|uniref:CbtA family protein n=1 Tax=Mycobacterium sp. Root265 TaxID=1736504 RepID=UPI00070BED6B|nr:CbtA family protein [Mycobacterium sp. Root265]KRD05210.1 cobalt transporter [Mycobacterium sp. Root265]